LLSVAWQFGKAELHPELMETEPDDGCSFASAKLP